MDAKEMDALISAVTQQVMAALATQDSTTPQEEGRSKTLVLAKEGTPVSEELYRGSIRCDLQDFQTHRNILRYQRVIVSDLNMTQLCDAAQGRMGDDVTRAILFALLSGVEVLMSEKALIHRFFAGKGSSALYRVYENYVRTLQVYGVKLVSEQYVRPEPEAKPPRYAAPPLKVPGGSAKPSVNRLVSEELARELVKAGRPVCLAKGSIVTPLAKDVFAQARISWSIEE